MSERPAQSRRWGMVVAVVLIGVFYGWTEVSAKRSWRWGERQQDYYNLLVRGFLDGQLNLKVEVPPELARLKDPYDPAQRPPGLGLHDATFYRGKYYIYFGVVPAVVLLLPFTVITGVDLPLPAAVGIFVLGGFLMSVAMWREIIRRYFRGASGATGVAGVLVLGLASMGPVLLRRPTVYELAIASAYFFGMSALWWIGRAMHGDRRRVACVAAASLCLGLAVGSRPSYVLAAPLALVPLAWWWWRQGRSAGAAEGGRDARWPMVLAGVLPLAGCGGLLALYNYLRFGHVAEFGVSYMFSGVYESRMTHFSPAYFTDNLRNYFLAVPEWSEWFPFIQSRPWPSGPVGSVAGDGYFGVLTTLPVTWLAVVGAAILWWRRRIAEEATLRVWWVSVLLMAVGTAALLMGFYASAARYQVDFVPALVLAGCVGALALEAELATSKRRWLTRVGRGVVVGAMVYSAGFGVLVSLEVNGELKGRNRALFQAVARGFNQVPAWIEAARGVRYGPLELLVQRPPEGESGRDVTVFLAGEGEARCRVFLAREAGGKIRVGLEHGNRPVRLSRWFDTDWSKPHRIRIDLGAFYPAPEHPADVAWRNGSAVAPEHRLRIEWDGDGLIEGRESFARLTPGGIAALRKQGAGWPSEAWTTSERVRLRVRFPAPGTAEAETRLETIGERGGALLYLKPAGERGIRFGFRSEAGPSGESEVIAVDRGAVHELEFSLRSAESGAREPRLECVCDGAIVWTAGLPAGSARGGFVGERKGTGTDGARGGDFSAAILSRERFADGQDPLLAAHGPVSLRVEFPQGRTGAREPLITTGAAGRGDFFCVEYIDATHVRFAFDHWGRAMRQSEPLAIDYGRAHDLQVTMGGLLAGPEWGPVEAATVARIAVQLDGRTVWVVAAEFHAAGADELYVGANPIGGTGCAPRFTGAILEVKRGKKPDSVR